MLARKSNKGFTLAEVLVTLAVIGVVAAMAIPALLGTTNEAELKVALKKAVSTMNQAVLMSIAQEGVDASSVSDAANSAANLTQFFQAKLNVIANGTDYVYTADGMKFTFKRRGSSPCGTTATDDPGTAECYVVVDVNGDKSPNVLSSGNTTTAGASEYTFKDQYNLIIKAKAVVPANNTTDSVAQAALSN